MLPIGIKICHPDHGEGEVIGYNGIKKTENPLDPCERTVGAMGILSTFSTSRYTGDIYPNIIQFKSGHKDVYADGEVTVIN